MQQPLHEVTLDRLLGALPELSEIAPLREALLAGSVADPDRLWSRASSYTTYDKRIVTAAGLVSAINAATHAAHARIDAVYSSIARLVTAFSANDSRAAAEELLSAGREVELQDNFAAAVAWYEAAVRVSEQVSDRGLRAAALRTLANAHVARGAMEAARRCYRNSLEQATAAEDTESRVIAYTGLGNVAGYQGRYDEALAHFNTALGLCGDEHPRRRALLFTNMASMLSEQDLLEEASARLADASALWEYFANADRCIWYNSRGLLALNRGEIEMAEGILHQALAAATTDFERAMVLDNLAELFIQQGNLSESESLARAAEEAALRAGSPRALAEIYTRLGKIFRLRSDANGVTFFEKAVEICRAGSYPHIEAKAYLEYGLFRRLHGDHDEARSYFQRAKQLFGEVGAARMEGFATEQLAQI